MEGSKTNVALFLGAGFSVPSGYPCTAQLNENLLETPPFSRDIRVEKFITAAIRRFWDTVFAWRPGMREPSLEDHFTQIDMAVKSGHGLGPDYGSTKLGAMRRLTIHRIFSWLRRPKGLPEDAVYALLRRLSHAFEVTIITTNWDTHVECIFEDAQLPFNYGVDDVTPDGKPVEPEGGVSLLKLHGCVNMSYCECCQAGTRLEYSSSQAVTDYELLLHPSDFLLLGADAALADLLKGQLKEALSTCRVCGARLGVPVLTFTYRKDLEKFRVVWDLAKTALQLADRWLFVGYSMPEADVEVRHLLKSTQFAHADPATPLIDVVLKGDCEASQRYQRFFGLPCERVFQDGIGGWVARRLDVNCP
jgi:NAD-dependent SIR2 family protein deacetylase